MKKMLKLKILLLLLFFGLVRLDSIDFADCGSNYYILDVDIEGCTAIPCCLTIGAQHRISMKLFANKESEILTQQVYLILKTIYSGVDVTPDDPCTQIPCPVSNNLDVSFSAVMNINSTLVPLSGELKWIMYSGNGDTLVCIQTEIGLRSAVKAEGNCKTSNET